VKTYEAMFLMDPNLSNDWGAAETEVRRILDRAEAKVLGVKNWEERKLAYPIGPNKRGLYALSYFEALPDKITGIERDVHLSEKTMRVLVIRRECMTPDAVEKALAALPPPKTPARGGDEWSSPGFGSFGGPGGPRREGGFNRGPEVVIPEEIPDLDAIED
jgi:ribosomal protein S6